MENLAVHGEPGIKDNRTIAVNQGMFLAINVNIKSGRGERVTVADHMHPFPGVRELPGHRGVGPHLQSCVRGQRGAHGVRS